MSIVYARRRGRTRHPGASSRRARAARIAPLLGLLLGACDIPTTLPKWDTEWLVPSRSTTIAASELLPSNMSVSSDRSAFVVNVPQIMVLRTLGDFCGSLCTAAAGLTVPKPAFVASTTDTLRLPASLAGATVASGAVALSVINAFDFDPIRPSSTGARGSITIALTSAGRTVGSMILSGDSVALPSGGRLDRTLALSPGPVGNKLVVTVTINSPLGDPVQINPSEQINVTITPQPIRLSDASVNVSQDSVSLTQTVLTLGDIDQSIIDRVKGGALVLTVTNPFGVTGTLDLDFQQAAIPVQKQFTLQAGTSTSTIEFTQQELKALLGRSILLTATGTVNAAAPVTITPAEAVQISTQLQLTLGPKEG